MNEKYLFTEQIDRLSISEPGLTANSAPRYAEYGDIFMAETTAEHVLPAHAEKALKPEETINEEASGHTDWEAMPEEKKTVIEDKINRYDGRWEDLIKDENETVYIIELARTLQASGVTLEQFLKDRKFYEKNLHLFEKKDKAEEEKSRRLIKKWEDYFKEIDKKNGNNLATLELNSKWYIIHTLAISANLGPYQFARLYNWDSFFSAEKPETRSWLKQLLVEIVKEQVIDIISGTFADDPNLTLEENKKRRQDFARILWGGTNQKRKEDAVKSGQKDPVSVDELSVQNKVIELGITPSRLKKDKEGDFREIENPVEVYRTSKIDNKPRLEKVEEIIREFSKDFKFNDSEEDPIRQEFIDIHNIGQVYELTASEIADKAERLHEWLKNFTGITDDNERRMLVRKLIEKGLAGESDSTSVSDPLGMSEEKAPKTVKGRDVKKKWDNWIKAEEERGRVFTPREKMLAKANQLEGISPEDSELSKEKVVEFSLTDLSEAEQAAAAQLIRMIADRDFYIDLEDPGHQQLIVQIIRELKGRQLTEEEIQKLKSEFLSQAETSLTETRRPQIQSEEQKEDLSNLWNRYLNELQKEEVNAQSPNIQRQVNYAITHGLTPDQYEIKFPDTKRKKAEKAWERYKKIQDESGVQLTEGQKLGMAARIRRGEMPPAGVWEIPEIDDSEVIVEDESFIGEPTMWEQVQDIYSSNISQFDKIKREEHLFEYENVKSIEDLAWQVGKSEPEKYGVEADNPVLEIVYKDDCTIDGKDYKKGARARREHIYNRLYTEEKVNKANFILWMRDRMNYMHGDEPDDPINFEQEITIPKNYRPISFGEIRKNPGKYFRREKVSRDRKRLEAKLISVDDEAERQAIKDQVKELPSAIMEDLLDEIKRETWAFTVTRYWDLNYRARGAVKDEFTKLMKEIFARSPFTKHVWGRSLFDWVFTMDQHYGTGDHKVGAAILGAYNVYYNLTDTQKLREIMGPDAALLTRNGLQMIRDKAAGIDVREDKGQLKKGVVENVKQGDELVARFVVKNDDQIDAIRNNYFSDKAIDNLFYYSEEDVQNIIKTYENIRKDGFYMPDKQFVPAGTDPKTGKPRFQEVDAHGRELINEWRFIEIFNVNSSPEYDVKAERMLRLGIQDFIKDRYKLLLTDNESDGYKVDINNVLFAELFANTMNRWTGAQARNNQTVSGYDAWVALQKTRPYRIKYLGRGEAYGNPYTVDQIRTIATDLFTGIQTETLIKQDEKVEGSRYSGRGKKAKKSALEVIEEMLKAWDLGESDEEKALLYEKASRQHVYPANTLKNFSINMLDKGMNIYDQVIDAQEIKLEKFTKFDQFKGVTFERDQFQAAVQDKFIKPMRYLLSTWSHVDFAATVRENRGNGNKTGWVEVSNAERMFGFETLDIPEFWERVEEPKAGDSDYEENKRKFNQTVKDQGAIQVRTRSKDKGKGWEISWRIPHKISGQEVNTNRAQLVKQLAKTRLAAELYSHIDFHSTDPRYDFRFYETILSALESIPGGIESDEFNMKGARLVRDEDKRFFSKEDIDWIRRNSNTTRFRLFGGAFLKALFEGLVKGTRESIQISAKQISLSK